MCIGIAVLNKTTLPPGIILKKGQHLAFSVHTVSTPKDKRSPTNMLIDNKIIQQKTDLADQVG